jgi:hypothetical protein
MKLRLFLAVAALAAAAPAARAAEAVTTTNNSSAATVGGGVEGYGSPYAENVYPVPGGPWHTGYYHTAWAKPVPLVVPPTAKYQTMWGWGVGNFRVAPVYQQFEGPAWGQPYMGVERWYPTPYWPYDTLQFGVYYIRGPW